MLNNLKAELARKNLGVSDIQKVIGKSARSVRDKLEGKSAFSVPDAIKVRDELFPGLSLDYLYVGGDERDSA